jgi:hypothetical protein
MDKTHEIKSPRIRAFSAAEPRAVLPAKTSKHFDLVVKGARRYSRKYRKAMLALAQR